MPRAIAVLLSVSILAFSTVACGGDDDDSPGTAADAAPPRPDARALTDAGSVVECPDGELGNLGRLETGSGLQVPRDPRDPDGPQVRSLLGRYGSSILLVLSLHDGRGAFAAGGAEIGTFPLEGEMAPDACGICLGFTLPAGPVDVSLSPVSGTITFDEIDGAIAGSLSNLALQQLDMTGEPLEGGCSATLISATFDGQLIRLP
jgi:hypothetical protein